MRRKMPLKYKRIIKECPVCEKEFIALIGHKREKQTCSHSCANTYFRSGENNPNYKGANGTQYREHCWRYHKKECIVCGENRIVAVHHYDGNNKNNEPDNLIPMCPTHHQYYHSSHRHLVVEAIERFRSECSVIR